MPNKPLQYIRLLPDGTLPDISELPPYKAILVIEDAVSELWQWEVGRWLANSGCRYMMVWGENCVSWEESVEEANLEAFDYEDIPEDRVIITASHEDEDLSEVFWFAKHRASHPAHELRNTVILHISSVDKQRDMESGFEEA